MDVIRTLAAFYFRILVVMVMLRDRMVKLMEMNHIICFQQTARLVLTMVLEVVSVGRE